MTNKIIQLQTDKGIIGSVLYEPAVKKTDALVVFFHGRGEFGDGSDTTLKALSTNGNHANLLKFAEKYGFRVLAPQVNLKLTVGLYWWTIIFIRAIIKASVKLTTLGKIGISGLSQGGGSGWMAITDPECAPLIFGAILICPTAQYEGDFSLIAKNGIAVHDFHAVNDTTVGVASSRNMVAKANSFNPNPKVKYDELDTGGHYIWSICYDKEELYPWLLSFAPGEVTVPIPPVDPLPVDEILSVYKLTNYKSGKATLEKL